MQRLVSYLTPCFPHLLVYCSLINPAEGANLASGSSTGHPGLKGAPWGTGVGAGCVQTQILRGRGLSSFKLPTLTPSSPFPGLYKEFWPLC